MWQIVAGQNLLQVIAGRYKPMVDRNSAAGLFWVNGYWTHPDRTGEADTECLHREF